MTRYRLRPILIALGLFLVCAPLRAQAMRFAYVANDLSSSVSVYRVDANTGALTLASVASAGTEPLSVAVDPGGRFAYVANQVEFGVRTILAYAIDANTGALTQIPARPSLQVWRAPQWTSLYIPVASFFTCPTIVQALDCPLFVRFV